MVLFSSNVVGKYFRFRFRIDAVSNYNYVDAVVDDMVDVVEMHQWY
jgi:hypothetical protein